MYLPALDGLLYEGVDDGENGLGVEAGDCELGPGCSTDDVEGYPNPEGLFGYPDELLPGGELVKPPDGRDGLVNGEGYCGEDGPFGLPPGISDGLGVVWYPEG